MKKLPISRDRLYADPYPRIGAFEFDDAVATVFDDMIERSVPGYRQIIAMIGALAQRYAQSGTRCYDLGCSLGAATMVMRSRIPADRPCRLIAVDNSPAMMARCRAHVTAQDSDHAVSLICGDIRDVRIRDASIVILNFTLQFISPDQRSVLVKSIFDGLRPDGILVISEKIAFADPDEQLFQEEMHHTFKKMNGYSDLEISQKRTALENVLIPDTMETHRARLKEAGFPHAHVWFRCFNFMSMVAHR